MKKKILVVYAHPERMLLTGQQEAGQFLTGVCLDVDGGRSIS